MRILVIGGTRFMGRETVLALGAAGHEVTIFNRGNHRVDWPFEVVELRGDRTLAADLAQLKARHFDAVIDFAAYNGDQVRQLMEVISPEAHVVLISSGAIYRPIPELPWAESGPTGPWSLWGQYGQGKLEAETVLRGRTTAASTLLRLPYVLGPLNYADREEFLLNRLMDHKKILIPGDGQAVIQFVSAKQVGSVVLSVVERLIPAQGESASGAKAFNIASPECLATLAGLVEICSQVADRPAETRHVSKQNDPGADSPLAFQSLIYPFPNVSYILDTSRAEEAGILPEPASLHEIIAESYEALVRTPQRRAWQRTEGERSVLAKF